MALGVGLEVSPSAIRAVVVDGSGTQVKLIAVQGIPCETAQPDPLTRALTQLRQTLRLTSPVVLGVPSTSAILATVHPLVVNLQRSALAVEFELQQQLPFELDQAVWHYQWLASANGHSQRRTVGSSPPAIDGGRAPQPTAVIVAAMRRSLLEERLACCRRAGLTVAAVAINPIATLNAWHARRPAAQAEAVTLISMIDEQAAEWIVGTPTSLHVVPVVSPSPETFWSELAASWNSFHTPGTPAPNQVWAVSPSASWPRLQNVLTAQCGLQVEQLEVPNVVSHGATGSPAPSDGPFVTALGLALQGLGRVRLPLNLVAHTQSEQRTRRIRRVAVAMSSLLALATIALGLGGMMALRHRRADVLETLERQERRYQTLRTEAKALLQEQQHTETRLQQLERIVAQSSVLTQVLSRVAEVMPDDVWLTKFECAKGALTVSTSDSMIEVVNGLMEGRAKSFQAVTQFLERLKSVEGMAAVKPLSTTVTADPASGKDVIVFAAQLQRPLTAAAPKKADMAEPDKPTTRNTPKKATKKAQKKAGKR